MKKTVMVLMALSVSAKATAASFAGNGADLASADKDAAWFIGERPIRYCVSVADDFGATESEVSSEVARAFLDWKAYLRKKNINEGFEPKDQIHLNVSEVTCDGTEDIKLYFGNSDASVEQYKVRYTEPLAFSQKTQYDIKSRWGRGFVWVAKANSFGQKHPDWQVKNKLYAILKHEIGHILGCGHMNGTIMSPIIANYVLSSQSVEKLLSGIDESKELRICESCSNTFQGKADGSFDTSPKIFKDLTGRHPVGDIEVKFIENPIRGSDMLKPRYEITLSDDAGDVSLKVDWNEEVYISDFTHEIPIFKRVIFLDVSNPNRPFPIDRDMHTRAWTKMAKVKGVTGKVVTLLIHRNLHRMPFLVQVFADNNFPVLFFEAHAQ